MWIYLIRCVLISHVAAWPKDDLFVFYGILNAAVVNYYILYSAHKPQNNLKRRFFQKKLAISLIRPLVQRRPANPRLPPAVRSTIHSTFPDLMSAIPAQVPQQLLAAIRCQICRPSHSRRSQEGAKEAMPPKKIFLKYSHFVLWEAIFKTK